MTREEAINILSRPKTMKNTPSDILEAHKMAIEVLEQEPCDDVISRQAAVDAINALHEKSNAWLDSAVDAVMALPPVTPQSETGRWIDVFGGCECSKCGCLEAGYSDYCPNCGVQMQEAKNDTNDT